MPSYYFKIIIRLFIHNFCIHLYSLFVFIYKYVTNDLYSLIQNTSLITDHGNFFTIVIYYNFPFPTKDFVSIRIRFLSSTYFFTSFATKSSTVISSPKIILIGQVQMLVRKDMILKYFIIWTLFIYHTLCQQVQHKVFWLQLLMLTTNMIRKDLNSQNQYDAGVALSGLSCFISPDLSRDLANDIMTLVTNQSVT